MIMDRVVSGVIGFGRFWYEFIIGDDWTIAATVVVGLVVTAVLKSSGIVAWWLVPVLVVAIVGVSLRRESRTHH
ncbi:MAG: hypothetical protein E6I22_04525 [Chloroflexi bacterium]|nr:MAG: hypothetical protein E6I22_04525 [Chloroflexota bacterium]